MITNPYFYLAKIQTKGIEITHLSQTTYASKMDRNALI